MGKPERVKEILEKINMGIASHRKEFLIGLTEVDEDSYCDLLNFAGSLIKKEAYILRDEKCAIISAALVQFAIREFQNGQFWSEFSTRLDLDEADVIKICKKTFEEFCEKNNLYFHVGNKNKGYVTSILTHAILPDSSLLKFFEFLQDLYFRDLEEDYIDAEVEELIQYMHRLFSKYLEEDDISLVVQGSKMTIANQQLPKAFRIAFVKATSVVVPIIERLLYYINQSNYSEVVEYLEKDRFDDNFESYSYSFKVRSNNSSKRKSGAERTKKFHVAQYYHEQGKMYMQIPKQIIDLDHIEHEIFLEVVDSKSIIHREKVLLTKSRLFFKTEQAVVSLTNFHSQLSFRIACGNETIYSSGDALFREYMIFDLEGNELSPKRLTDDTVKVITNAESEVLSDDAQIDIAYKANYRISTVFLNEESLLLINDKVLSTNVATIRNEICTKNKYCGVVIKDSSKKEYEVYSEIPEIRIRVPYLRRIDDFIITVNNVNFPLNEIITFEMKLISDGSGDELGIGCIHDQILLENNPAQITIREKGTNRIYIEEKIFVLKSLNYEFSKRYYYREKMAEIIKLESDEIEFTKDTVLPERVNIKINKFFRTEFLFNGNIFQLHIELPVLTWRLGILNSDINKSSDVWWEDVDDQKLFIKYPNMLLSQLHVITGTSYEKIQGKKIGDEVRYSLDHLFQITNQDPITLGIKLYGNEERITEVHFKPFIEEFSVAYYDNKTLGQGLYAQWDFMGSGDLHVDLIYSPTRHVIKQYMINGKEHLMDRDIELNYSEHEVEIYQTIEDDFFGNGTEKIVLLHKKFIVGDPVIVFCKNKLLKGISCISDSERFNLSNFYLKDIKFSRKRGFYEATGMYFIRDRYTGNNRKCYFTNHNPFLIKPVSIDQNKVVFEIVDRDQDGLIYDIKTKHVNPREEEHNESRYKLIDEVELEIVK